MKTKLIILILLFNINCVFNFGNFKRYSLDAPNNLEETSTKKVSGSDCVFLLGWAFNSIGEATRDAIKKSPAGTTGLRDVNIIAATYPFVSCMEVEGIPVKEKETVNSSPSKMPSKK